MLWARVVADAIVVFHAAFVGFVVLGMAAIVVGLVLGWGWVRNFWFRAAHLGMIGFVVLESFIGMVCPLTRWENQLRRLGGQEGYPGDFIGYWAHRLLFYRAEPWVFTVIYTAFGATVFLAFLLGPPRLPDRWRRRTADVDRAVTASHAPTEP
jgi:hypothetical protein